MSTAVSVSWDGAKINQISGNVARGLVRMGYDMAALARANAPYRTGALSNSIRVEENGEFVEVIAGGKYAGKDIRYAAIQEFGGNAGKGRRAHIVGRHYMERARDYILAGDYIGKYFGGVVK